MCVCERERERLTDCVRERGGVKEGVCVCERERKRERKRLTERERGGGMGR